MIDVYKEILKSVGLKVQLKEAPPKPEFNGNLYIWWRRFGTHPYLKSTAHAIEKAKNGDFNLSKYWTEIQYEYWYLAEEIYNLRQKLGYISFPEERNIITSYNKRIKKLTEDALLDDEYSLKDLAQSLRRNYGGSIEQSIKFIDTFEGEETIEEAIIKYPLWLNENKS